MGLVAVSKTIPGAIITLAGTLNQNCAPAIIQTWARGDKATIMRELRGCMKISSVLVSVPIVVFCVFGHSFYSLWQPTLEAKTLTVLSVLGLMPFVPVAGTQTLYNVFTAMNKLQVNSIAFLVNGVLNDSGNYGYYWSVTPNSSINGAYDLYFFYYDIGNVLPTYGDCWSNGYSVRCLKE